MSQNRNSETLGSSLVSELKLGLGRTRNRSQNRNLDIPSLRFRTGIKILIPNLFHTVSALFTPKSAVFVIKMVQSPGIGIEFPGFPVQDSESVSK